jgi:molybdate transport system ATP-binding protein
VAERVKLDAAVRLTRGDLELDATLSVSSGELVVLLGPNGAGKTTLLSALAGLLPLERGRVELGGEVLEDPAIAARLATHRRSIGFVFQDYLLFDHMTVLDNVAFGLRARGADRAAARRNAHAWLERMALVTRARAKPRALSGGQAQRVALARALAIEPQLLLLDEPLAALDAGARAEVRRDLRRHLGSFDGASLLVTHDPVEAMLLADRLLVLEGGRIVQSGSAEELRARPRSSYIAGLVGLNLFRGRADRDGIRLASGATLVAATRASGEVMAVVHPRAVALYRELPQGSPRNVWPGTVAGVDLEGDRVRVSLDGRAPVVAEVTPAAASELGLTDGAEVWISIKAAEVTVYPA